MAAKQLAEVRFLYGEDKYLQVTATDDAGASLASFTGTVTITNSAGTAIVTNADMTESGTTTRIFTYLLTTGAAQTITAAGVYYAVYTLTDGTQVIQYEQVIRVVTSPSLLTGMPNADDLSLRLTEAGLTPPSAGTMQQEIDQAVRTWERITGFVPFLADSNDTTWYFTPRGDTLIDFGMDNGPGGFVSITSIAVEVTYGNATGVAQTADRDYLLHPSNATNKSEPYTYVTFRRALFDYNEHTVKVVGKAGYASTLPADVFNAILKQAFRQILPSLTLSTGGGLDSWKEADVSESLGGGKVFEMAGSQYDMEFYRTALRYKRLRVM